MTDEEHERLLEDCASMLGEHFDAVQILACVTVGGLTKCVKRGTGNWYARQGMAHEFIEMEKAQEIAVQINGGLK
jgi:hypothetical protein